MTAIEFSTARLEQLVNERATLTGQRDTIVERIAELDAIIAGQLDKGTHQVGDHKVTVTIPERVDPKKIEAAFPVIERPEFYKPALNLDAVKENLSPAALAEFKTAGRPQIRVS